MGRGHVFEWLWGLDSRRSGGCPDEGTGVQERVVSQA